jgi:YD repeat-containing protein
MLKNQRKDTYKRAPQNQGASTKPMEVRTMLRKGWSLKQVRRTLAQGTVGKAIAIVLGIAMVAPSLAMPSIVANANPTRGGGGLNSAVSSLESASSASAALETFAAAFASAFASTSCPPDVPILTLPNGDATRDGIIDDIDYGLVEDYLGTTHPSADLNGDGKVNNEDLAIVKANMGLISDAPWTGNFPEPHGWHRLQFAVQLGDYFGSARGRSVRMLLRESSTGRTFAFEARFEKASIVTVDVGVPTAGRYAVQVQAPAGGSWLTITRTDVQTAALVPNTFGTPFAWQGGLPVPYGVLNLWNGNLMAQLGLFAWGGQAGVSFGLFYNAQDDTEGVLGVGWRHSYEASLEMRFVEGQRVVELSEPDGRRLIFAEQPDGSYVPPRGVYAQLQYRNGVYELVRPSQERWVFEPISETQWRLTAIRDLHNQGVALVYDSSGRLTEVRDTARRSMVLAYYAPGDTVPLTTRPVPEAWYGRLKSVRDAIGRVWQFTYQPGDTGGIDFPPGEDEGSRVYLSRVIYPPLRYEGEAERYHWYRMSYAASWSGNRRVLSMICDRAGYGVSYGYDVLNRLISYSRTWCGVGGAKNKCTVTVSYPAMLGGGHRVEVYVNGRLQPSVTYGYDDLGRLVQMSDILGRTTQMGWNTLYQLSWVRSPSGAVSSFCWDERGNLTRAEDPLGNWVELEWNALNRLSKIRDMLTPAGAYRMEYEHNPTGDLETVVELAGQGTNYSYAKTQYVWDVARGLLQEAWDAEGHRTQNRVYDEWGYLQQVQDALGHGGEVLQRNALGWVERVRNARGREIEYRYDSWGRLRKKIVWDANGHRMHSWTEYQYADAEGRIERVEASNGWTVEYQYDRTVLNMVRLARVKHNGTVIGEVEYLWEDGGLLDKLYVRAGGSEQRWRLSIILHASFGGCTAWWNTTSIGTRRCWK